MVELVLGDDHAVFVEALITVLPHHGFRVLDTADSIAATTDSVRRYRPDVCVLDRYFADGDAVDSLDEISAAGGSRMRVVLLTADRDEAAMTRAMRAGASGYVNKMCGLEALVDAVRRASVGEPVTRLPAASHGDDSTNPRRSDRGGPLIEELTPRERQVLELIVAGARTVTMAHRLGVSRTTVRTHVQALLTKLGVHSRLEASAFALRHKLLDTDTSRGRIG